MYHLFQEYMGVGEKQVYRSSSRGGWGEGGSIWGVANYCSPLKCIHNERCEGRKKEASKVKQTNKAKQYSTPKTVTFPEKNELPRVGLEPTTHGQWECI